MGLPAPIAVWDTIGTSYGVELVDLYRRAPLYVDRILKGEKPSDLRSSKPPNSKLLINVRTASADPRPAHLAACAHRRGDRIGFAPLHMSLLGTSRHFAVTRQFSRFWSEADMGSATLTEPNLLEHGLVSFDSEVRNRGRDITMRTSESGH